MRISDWSSDVCSSDLSATGLLVDLPTAQNGRSITAYAARKRGSGKVGLTPRQTEVLRLVAKGKSNKEVGRDLGMLEGTVKAQLRDRKDAVEGKRVSVRVDLGGRRIIKKKKNIT